VIADTYQSDCLDMTQELDIIPLRSLIAVADAGGFHKAAADLRLSQSAVSQHIRRLERVIGRPVVEPDGRGARLTSVGVDLLAEARKIMAAHDEALRRLCGAADPAVTEFVIGTTDHAADHILPPIIGALTQASPGLDVKFRFDRTTPLNEAVDRGNVDLAVFITEASTRKGTLVGALPLVWCAAPGWLPPSAGQPWPLIAIEAPCAIRGRALALLGEHGIRSRVVADAAYLAGVVNAARAGVGVALLALAGPPPEGLVALTALPAASPISLTARVRPGADQRTAQVALRVLHATLAAASEAVHTPASAAASNPGASAPG
jgi:DNA-binding transcriptional LysR family regulator